MKRIIALLLCLCTICGLVACAPTSPFAPEPSITAAERPEDWDQEAEFLRFINGFFWSESVSDMRKFSVKGTTSKQMESSLNLYKEFRRYQQGDFPNVFDYPYDTVELTFLETYNGYEIFYFSDIRSTAYEAAVEAYKSQQPDPENVTLPICSPVSIWALTIQDGKYVACLDERLVRDLNNKLSLCSNCYGTPGVLVPIPGEETCTACNGEGYVEAFCIDCGAPLATATTPCECGTQLIDKPNWLCEHCKETGKEPVFVECPECQSLGYTYRFEE